MKKRIQKNEEKAKKMSKTNRQRRKDGINAEKN